jgi:hypothetical protein
MLAIIAGCNCAGLWMLFRPKPVFGPSFTLLAETESHDLMAKFAGEYLTGSQEGDRRLVIQSDGTLHLSKFGPKHAIVDETTRLARGGLSGGLPAVITGDPYVVSIKDPETVVFSGTIYHRRN